MSESGSKSEVLELIAAHYGRRGQLTPLPSYVDENWKFEDESGETWVFKIAHPDESFHALELQAEALEVLSRAKGAGLTPRVQAAEDGRFTVTIKDDRGRARQIRLVSWLEGETLAAHRGADDVAYYRELGAALARIDRALAPIASKPRALPHPWDGAFAHLQFRRAQAVADPGRRDLLRLFQRLFLAEVKRRLPRLPRGLIHHDANDHNLLVRRDEQGRLRHAGVLDFGDMIETARVFEIAVAGAYAVFGAEDPLEMLGALAAGYHAECPLNEDEVAVLFPAVATRLVLSVINSAEAGAADPDNKYIRISEEPAWKALERLSQIPPRKARERLEAALGFSREQAPADAGSQARRDRLLERRRRVLGPNLSLSPVEIVKGRGAYLFDEAGRPYLDAVNNVAHVGHSHPRVIDAGLAQWRELNTNTRYLHEGRLAYAERLLATLPDSLEVLYLVNSGSEANELALRLARTATARSDAVVLEAAYHGHTTTLIDLSPYKHGRAGGQGPPDWVHVADLPRADVADTSIDAALHAAAKNGGAAAFFAESISGCGGQYVFPDGYLEGAFEKVRAAGGLCVIDEVQVGFGRVGSHWWAFQTQGVTPDIVTMGKPIGNGHPMAAVATTRVVADAFANGMEYFCTFGGNPVSCAVGMAVLDVIEDEDLRGNATRVGEFLKSGLSEIAKNHGVIADVRGLGLFLGVEFQDESGRPAPEPLAALKSFAQERGLFISIDGPFENVMKIKPPLCFSQADAAYLLDVVAAGMDRYRPA